MEHERRVFRRISLRNGGEPGNVGEEHGDPRLLAAGPDDVRVLEDMFNDGLVHVLRKGPLDELSFPSLQGVAEDGGKDEAHEEGHHEIGRRDVVPGGEKDRRHGEDEDEARSEDGKVLRYGVKSEHEGRDEDADKKHEESDDKRRDGAHESSPVEVLEECRVDVDTVETVIVGVDFRSRRPGAVIPRNTTFPLKKSRERFAPCGGTVPRYALRTSMAGTTVKGLFPRGKRRRSFPSVRGRVFSRKMIPLGSMFAPPRPVNQEKVRLGSVISARVNARGTLR